ncbi:major facilitator superfamily transporter [[Clostridium] sordellii]|uniref:Major facilitator superfamily protein n=1 Tax=Paraclostridium sordellii TaxID=1505 RepID=A0ABP1XQ17_PARSO|nr:MFS transporter [Paeniclostridium sordellii]CEJ73465.1 major facilitator superfamily protein [[Clostridium] sordellii] [Paeniclostridium sordellii]CEN69016.1 major facilitator superfamily transporter [[Clostridium] sordellii] [Paeniclostridium sordellii]CEN72283.1 major facilitator superfamily transporter [[Clostridium] sordellii] [Paeniclostridium sordellii]CEO23567.1 major facilitator superfamily transporter [[Clostridium] sordellii] [Paeniclostridium sordellii]CEP76124.1 major facilitato
MNLIKNRVFVTILVTDIIQQMAIWIRNIAIMFFIMDLTNKDPLAISALNFIEYLPMFLLTFVGGIIADRYNPKKIMFFGDLFSFISFIILGVVISKGYIGAIFLVVLVSASVTQFSYPSSQKYFKEYVDEDSIDKAIGISQLLSSGFFVIGPFIGSQFYFNFGIDKTLMIISLLFLISIALILTLPNKNFEKIKSSGFIEDIGLTFKYLNEKEILKLLTKMFFVVSFAMGIANNLDIFLVTDRLGLSEEFYQFFSGIAGVGVIVGGGIYLLVSKHMNIKVLYILIGVFSITVFFEGYSTNAVLTMMLQFIDNVLGGILSGYVMTLITKVTDQEYLGKVNGVTSTLMTFGIMVGTIFSGIFMKYASIVFAFFVASIAFLISFTILYKAVNKGVLKEVE